MLRFGIDIDGTVTTEDWLYPFIEKDFNITINPEDIVEYDLTTYFDGPKEDLHRWFKENEALLYSNPPLREKAKQILQNWSQIYELYFISARGVHCLETTKKWFQNGDLPFHHLELIGTHDKIATAAKHKVDLFFEDKHDNAVDIAEQCGIPVILFDCPYNRKPIPDTVIRVYNWQEAKDWVDHWLETK